MRDPGRSEQCFAGREVDEAEKEGGDEQRIVGVVFRKPRRPVEGVGTWTGLRLTSLACSCGFLEPMRQVSVPLFSEHLEQPEVRRGAENLQFTRWPLELRYAKFRQQSRRLGAAAGSQQGQ